MKWALYNLAFALVYPFLLPGFLFRMLSRGGYAKRFLDRFALYPSSLIVRFRKQARSGKRFVWIHAVSVGEVQVAGQLMREWRKAEADVAFCFSTTSSTGWKMAERELTDQDVLIYNPLDFPNFVKSAFRTIEPRALILTESEIWPNLIRYASKYRVPSFLINARVSDRSAPRYRKARFIFGDILRSFAMIFAQSETDRERLIAAGADPKRVEVTGSFKFDVAHRNPDKERELSAWIGEGPILLGGSTWPGEDAILLDIFGELKARRPELKLVIAPRHFEKADEVEANIKAAQFDCCRRSRNETKPCDVYLCDTTGELMGLYGIADIVFVGKSLCAHGSQNMIEPCLCGKPTLVGPYTENFRPVMRDLTEAEAIIQVRDERELKDRMVALLAESGEAAALGARAKAAVERRCGVVLRCVRAIRNVVAIMMIAVLFGCGDCEQPTAEVVEKRTPKSDYIYPPVTNACSKIVKLENPNDEEIIYVKELDVTGMRASEFKAELERMEGARVHVWMPGRRYWLLIGHSTTNKVSLAKAMDALALDDDCESLPELFGNYVGEREDILPAFEAELEGEVVPEWFVSKAVPTITWLDTAEIDEDILKTTLAEIRSMQIVRRVVLDGDMQAALAKDNADEEQAASVWARAALRNPKDLFLCERINRLERNAKAFMDVGKLLQAMKCYETIILIEPKNGKAVHNFGMCLKKIGKLDMAEKVLERAKLLLGDE